MILALKHFQMYLKSTTQPVVVFTDHNHLTFTHRMKVSNQSSDVRLTVKSVRFRFQKINRNRNRDLERTNVLPVLVLFFIHALKGFCKSWLTTQITPVLCGNTLKFLIKAKTAKCKLCTKDIAADYGNTSNLQRHIENKHKSEFEGLKTPH